MRRIHQFVENLVPGDAISNDCVQIYTYLNELGYDSHIYTRASLIKKSFIHHYLDPISADDGIIFHHSTNSPLIEYIRNLPNKKMLIYHNITPAAFFKEYNYPLFKIFKEAERQNYLFEDSSFNAIVGDSKYNLSLIKKFINAPYEEVIPPFLSLQFENSPSVKATPKEDDNFTMMFVGRFAPNKKQIDIIKVFEYYSKFINPKARLFLIGHYSFTEAYFNEIQSYIKDRNIQNIHIHGALTSSDLAQIYQEADVFLSMSEHEGFCIPILESIHFNVPVFAYKIPALEELLDEKFLFTKKNYKEIGDMLYSFQSNKKARKQVVNEQKKILNRFHEARLKSKFESVINTVFNV